MCKQCNSFRTKNNMLGTTDVARLLGKNTTSIYNLVNTKRLRTWYAPCGHICYEHHEVMMLHQSMLFDNIADAKRDGYQPASDVARMLGMSLQQLQAKLHGQEMRSVRGKRGRDVQMLSEKQVIALTNQRNAWRARKLEIANQRNMRMQEQHYEEAYKKAKTMLVNTKVNLDWMLEPGARESVRDWLDAHPDVNRQDTLMRLHVGELAWQTLVTRE